MRIPVDLRLGTPADTRAIAELMLLAGGGLLEQLLDDIVPGIGAEPLLALGLTINQTGSAFATDNVVVAERDGRAAGMILAFPTADYRLPDGVRGLVQPGRLQRVEALIKSCIPETFYIHSLAVRPEAARGGVARKLLRATGELAAAQGFTTVSLHVWDGNAPAMALYRSLGFVARRTVEVAPSAKLRWAGPVHLLTVDAATLLEAHEATARARVS